MRLRSILTAGVLCFVALSAAAYFTSPILRACFRSTKSFLSDPADSRVHYEPGAENLAKAITEELVESIRAVERVHGRPFGKPVSIYVCASPESFADYTGSPEASGCVINQRLFLSPRLGEMPERISKILRHELSHLHLAQLLGTFIAAHQVPHWFHEGLAVVASNGGGAENVSRDQAVREILRGRHIVLRPKGSLRTELFSPEKINDGLPPHLFYRQSSLFVEFLQAKDRTAFSDFMGRLETHVFSDAIVHAYGSDLPALWREFVERLCTN